MPQASKQAVKYTRTGRYYKLNSVSQKTKNIWIVFHGYGQLAKYFIKHFETLNAEENFIIAPEGLSRFYIDGLSGRVGASWMTKDDREDDIFDQSTYINAVITDCGINLKSNDARVIVLGFSQGTATAVRCMAQNEWKNSQLILWAGNFPHDVSPADYETVFENLSCHFVSGNEDPFLAGADIEGRLRQWSEMGLKVRDWNFKGKHVMDPPTLQRIVDSFETF